MTAPFAHVGGIPIEETIGSFNPALVIGVGVAWAKLRDRLHHRLRSGERARRRDQPTAGPTPTRPGRPTTQKPISADGHGLDVRARAHHI
jgi:hypothetical protein